MGAMLSRLVLCAALAGGTWSGVPPSHAQDMPEGAAPPPLSELEPDPPDMPQEPGPPAYATQQDPMCGKLETLLEKRLAAKERRMAIETHRSLHCPALAASGSSRPRAKHKHGKAVR